MSFAPLVGELELPENWSTVCQACGTRINDITAVRISYDGRNGTHINCARCFNNLFVPCETCQETDVRNQMASTDLGGSVCNECRRTCYIECADTGVAVHRDRAVQIGNHWYSPAAAARWTSCSACQAVIRTTDAQATGGVCNRCLRTVIREYSTRAEGNLSFLAIPTRRKGTEIVTDDLVGSTTKQRGLRYYGIELEVEHNQQNSKNVGLYQTAKEIGEQFQNFAIIKRDGSLQHGFEIVSAPATYEVHQVYWETFFKNYKERDQISSHFTTTCGMHVHVSKASLTPLQIGKILVFIYGNKNTKFISTIAQRGSNRYNNFTNPKTFVDAFGGDWIQREQRYTAVNLLNPNTIEIRLFKGTVSKDKFFKNLEFVKALIDYCETGVCSMDDCKSYKGFCKFVEKYATCYPYLYRFLVDAKYCEFKSKKPQGGAKRNIKAKLKKSSGKGKDILVAIDRVIPYAAPAPTPIYTYNSARLRKQFFTDVRRQNEARMAQLVRGGNRVNPAAATLSHAEATQIFNDTINAGYTDGGNNAFARFQQAVEILYAAQHGITRTQRDIANIIISDRNREGLLDTTSTRNMLVCITSMYQFGQNAHNNPWGQFRVIRAAVAG